MEKFKDTSRPIYYKAMSITDYVIDDTGRVAKMYFAAFGNRDAYGDILLKGCFAKSIKEHGPDSTSNQKIAYCWQHDIKNPLGRILVLKEDDKGLYAECAHDPIPDANRALIQLKSGTINQGSIGFRYIPDKIKYDSTTDSFLISEVMLYECSLVTIGANENTPFVGFKAEEVEPMREQLSRDIDKALKGIEYEKQIELRQLITKSIALSEVEPVKHTQQEEPLNDGVNWELISKYL